MVSVEALLEQHWDELLKLRDQTANVMLSTDPADRSRLESAITRTYRLAGMPPPRTVIWFDSPIEARVAAAI